MTTSPAPATDFECCDQQPARPRRYVLDEEAAHAYFAALTSWTDGYDADAPVPAPCLDPTDPTDSVMLEDLHGHWTCSVAADDETTVTNIVSDAWRAGWLNGPSSPDVVLDLGDDHYTWRTAVSRPDGEGDALWLTGYYEAWSTMTASGTVGGEAPRGADAAVAVLRDVVQSLNPVLDTLDALIVAHGGTV